MPHPTTADRPVPEPEARITSRAALPRAYRGEVHCVLHFGAIGGLAAVGAALLAARDPGALVLVAALVPPWGVVEYLIHRFVLHGGWWPALGRDHGTHHACFPAGAPFQRTHHDWYRVLQRPQDVLALEVVALVAAALAALAGPAAALVAATSANLYLLLYEGVHAVAHSERASSWPLLRPIARCHLRHHVHPGRDYAVVLPAVDRLFGTEGA